MSQEITTRSWFSRLIGSLIGVLIGIAMVVGAFILIFWNENHGLRMAQSLQQTEEAIVNIPNTPIDPKNNLRAVYLTGAVSTTATLKDKMFGIVENAIKLDRKVEMYQWKESTETTTESQLGGSEQQTKTFSYKQTWSETPIDSSKFNDPVGHQNPTEMPIQSKNQIASKVTVGDFTLSRELVASISGDTPIDLSKVELTKLKNEVNSPVNIRSDNIYIGENPLLPKVGDLKITITAVLPQDVSIIAQQNNHLLQPYVAPAGQAISLLAMGTRSSQQMIADELSANTISTWALRISSLILMVIGISLLMKPIVILVDIIPFLGSLVGVGTFFVAFIAGLCLWTIGISIAWFAVRPLWALGLIVIVGGLCYYLIKRRRETVE